MNRTLARLRALAVVSAIGVAFVQSHGFAQEAAPAPAAAASQDTNAPVPVATTAGSTDQEVLVLSPFVVEADEDTGYAATSTLAGTRIKTNLKDVGDAISVVTKKFLEDTDSTSSQELLVYTTNTEVGGQGGNFAGAGNGAVVNTQAFQESPQTNTRVRGLANADNTRNYFLTDIPWDSYNTDRIDIQRGPNSILFGLGSPAGIINATVTDASLAKDSGTLENKFGSFGTIRDSLQYNKVLLPDELAVNFAVLNDQRQFAQRPDFNDDKRYFVAVKYDPKFLDRGSAHTDIRVDFEHGDVDAINPNVLPPIDEITPWFTSMNKATYGWNSIGFSSTSIPNYDSSTQTPTNASTAKNISILDNPLYGANSTTYSDTAGNTITNPQYNPWLANNSEGSLVDTAVAEVFPNANSSISGGPNNGFLTEYSNEIDGPPGSGATAVVTGLGLGSLRGITSYDSYAQNANLPNSGLGLYKAKTLSQPSVFNYYNTALNGPNGFDDQDFNAFNAAVSETFFNGKAGVEFVIDDQQYTQSQYNVYASPSALSVDIMATTAGDSQLNDPANPNVGRAFTSGGGNSTFSNKDETKRLSYRATAFADLDFSDYFDKSSWIAQILGKDVFTGLYQKTTDNTFNVGYGGAAGGNDILNQLNTQTFSVGQVAYLSPNLSNASYGQNLNITGVQATQKIGQDATVQFFNLTPSPNNSGTIQTSSPAAANYSGDPYSYLGFTPTEIDVESPSNGIYLSGGSPSKDRATITSRALVWQGFFFDGNVVPTVGWRTDEATDQYAGSAPQDIYPNAGGTGRYYDPYDPNWTVSSGPNDPRNGVNGVTYNAVQGHSTSYSVVLHTPKFIKEKLPLESDLSLEFDQSSNFQPAAGRYDISGDPVPAPAGKTTERAIVFSTLNDRITLKINWYKTTITNGSLNANQPGGLYEVGYSYGWGDVFDDWAQDGPGNPNNWAFTNNFNVSTATATLNQLIDPNLPASAAGTPHWLAYQPNPGQSVDSAYKDEQAVLTNFVLPANEPKSDFESYWGIIPYAQFDVNHNAPLYSPNTPSNLSISDDNLSKGVEYELTAQPVKGWDLTFNASHTFATIDSVAQSYTEEVAGEETFFHSLVPGSDEGNIGGDVKEWNGYLNGQTAGNQFDAQFYGNYLYLKALTGTGVSEERPWRFNVITDYTYSSGPFKGVNVGAAYRWQDKQIIGYPFLVASTTFDTSHPFLSPVVDTTDAWIGYSRKISDKLKWRIQVNVRNLFYSSTLIPISAEPDGTTASARIPEPRTWEVTNSISF
jgi:outer membrane receptor protein involved in Fe transport